MTELKYISYRTLATDRGFKERVREDMLVRLLDAFVWRSQGTTIHFEKYHRTHFLPQTDMRPLSLDLHMFKE
jgi:hypothetical protein